MSMVRGWWEICKISTKLMGAMIQFGLRISMALEQELSHRIPFPSSES